MSLSYLIHSQNNQKNAVPKDIDVRTRRPRTSLNERSWNLCVRSMQTRKNEYNSHDSQQ